VKRRKAVSNKPSRIACEGCKRMAGEPRSYLDVVINLCAECDADQFLRSRALNRKRGEALGIQRVTT
jgi:hypothetical protein